MTLVPARLISRKCFDKSQEIFGFQLAKTDGGGRDQSELEILWLSPLLFSLRLLVFIVRFSFVSKVVIKVRWLLGDVSRLLNIRIGKNYTFEGLRYEYTRIKEGSSRGVYVEIQL